MADDRGVRGLLVVMARVEATGPGSDVLVGTNRLRSKMSRRFQFAIRLWAYVSLLCFALMAWQWIGGKALPFWLARATEVWMVLSVVGLKIAALYVRPATQD